MPNIEKRIFDMRIRSITRIDRQKEDSESTKYRMCARDVEGVHEIILNSATPFKGLSARDGIIQIVIQNSQKTIKDFQKEEKEEEE